MAVDSNALSLVDFAKMANDPVATAITQSMLWNGSVMPYIPTIPRIAQQIKYVRYRETPVPNWIKLNELPVGVKTNVEQRQETAYLLRDYIDVDTMLEKDVNAIGSPRANKLAIYLTGFAYDFNDKLINNSPLSGDSDCFYGLRYRLDNAADFGLESELLINAGALDVSPSGATVANGNRLVEYMQTALDYLGRRQGDNVYIMTNDIMLRRLEAVVRTMGTSGGFRITDDQFGRSILQYRNATFIDTGRKGSDQTTRIITATEAADGTAGASVHTSMYFAVFEQGRLWGWENTRFPDAIEDLGVMPDGIFYRYLSNWQFGLITEHSRSVARIYGIKVA